MPEQLCLSLFLIVFANMTNYVLDAESGLSFQFINHSTSLPTTHRSTYPLHHFVIWPIYLEDVGIVQLKNYLL